MVNFDNGGRDNFKKRVLESGSVTLVMVARALPLVIIFGLCVLPVVVSAVVTRGIAPQQVKPGDLVTVNFTFTTAETYSILTLRDDVPLGWTVTNIGATPASNSTSFNATLGKVLILWYNIDSGTAMTAWYTLHVPQTAPSGTYTLQGFLWGVLGLEDQWFGSIPNGTVVVQQYGVDLSVDEGVKTTSPNVSARFYLTVKNTGDISDTYNLSKNSEADYSFLNKTSVSLGAGASAPVLLEVRDSSPGYYNTTVQAQSAFSNDQITVTLIVGGIAKGDVNADGSIDFVDVIYLANYVVGNPGFPADATVADVNGDASVDFVDVIYLANYVVGNPGFDL